MLEIFATPQNQKTCWLVSHHMQLRYHYLMANPAGDCNAAGMTVNPGLLARYLDTLLTGWYGVRQVP